MNYTYKYPHPAVTTDCVVFGFDGEDMQILLIRRGEEPYKDSWALPGGFLKMDETVEECAKRELKEETALAPSFIEQFRVFSDVNRDPRERVVTVAFVALVRSATVMGGDDAAEARWFPKDALPPLAFDHQDIVRAALKHLQERIRFAPVGFDLLDEQFTIPQLQRIYELILGTSFDRRNFYRKIIQSNIVQPTEEPVGAVPLADIGCDGNEDAVGNNAVPEVKLVRQNINALFGESDTLKPTKHRDVGRKPSWFKLNLHGYLKSKNDDKSKLEF